MYGFVNVDIREEVQPDVVDDIFSLDSFIENSVDLIHASHVLEHINRDKALQAIKRWFSLLKEGGILRVAVPDIEEACKHYIYYKDLAVLYSMFWGSQKHEFDYHYTGWDFLTLRKDLEQVGFKDVHVYNPWETEYSYIDDYSKSYFPTSNIEFRHGKGIPLNRCMSLNVEGKK